MSQHAPGHPLSQIAGYLCKYLFKKQKCCNLKKERVCDTRYDVIIDKGCLSCKRTHMNRHDKNCHDKFCDIDRAILFSFCSCIGHFLISRSIGFPNTTEIRIFCKRHQCPASRAVPEIRCITSAPLFLQADRSPHRRPASPKILPPNSKDTAH